MSGEVEEGRAKKRRRGEVGKGGLGEKKRRHTEGNQEKERGHRLTHGQRGTAWPAREALASRSVVILAIHPRDRHDMRELPEKDKCVEHQRLEAQRPGRRRPSDQGWRCTRQGADGSAERRFSLQRRIYE